MSTAAKNTAPSEELPQRLVAPLYAALAAVIDPKPELHFSNCFELLIAVVLSAQATDRSVNAVTEWLFARCRTPEDFIAFGVERLEAATRTIGLYHAKSRAIIGLCRQLVAQHGGQVPADYDALTALPGVGPKTARVVLNVGFHQPVIAVDTHIFRVANRTGLACGKTPEAVSRRLAVRTPPRYRLHAHHYLLLHGRYTCTARAPQCAKCPIASFCRTNAAAARRSAPEP